MSLFDYRLSMLPIFPDRLEFVVNFTTTLAIDSASGLSIGITSVSTNKLPLSLYLYPSIPFEGSIHWLI